MIVIMCMAVWEAATRTVSCALNLRHLGWGAGQESTGGSFNLFSSLFDHGSSHIACNCVVSVNAFIACTSYSRFMFCVLCLMFHTYKLLFYFILFGFSFISFTYLFFFLNIFFLYESACNNQ
ncbi:hypothetical protein L228DRAFT_25684 [Xylona heveae TC161]|uniref:Uncharacterized protein n=1 Tax=Xylona heveae (strain CBS 132557 / TC161) TaxID=1328760 RepID=A0A165ADJ6_XYLHT|nr:hypothetical protein L228DRAFT_25684 [Xylona heveae TC161]KZF20301.1 hypothetical protein L228DRAFT_25684 [Xylona heveae TC161]